MDQARKKDLTLKIKEEGKARQTRMTEKRKASNLKASGEKKRKEKGHYEVKNGNSWTEKYVQHD